MVAVALVLTLGVGALPGTSAAEPLGSLPGWAEQAEGFASVNALGQNGTTGGAGGAVVTVTHQADLQKYAAAPEPYEIRVAGAVAMAPKGTELKVASDKTILGVDGQITDAYRYTPARYLAGTDGWAP